jgi:hypothetical protein
MGFKCDYAARAGLDAAPIWTKINCNMVNITGHEPTNEPPELARQNIRLAVHGADDIACLYRQAVDLISMDHICSVFIIREMSGKVLVIRP